MKKKILQPNKSVQRVICPSCNELLVKIYPNALPQSTVKIGCKKCYNKKL